MSHKKTKHRADSFALPRWLALALALAVTLIGGALYGSLSQRWGPGPDLVGAGGRVTEMPSRIGRWKLVEEIELKPSVIEMLECVGYVSRRYVHLESGKEIILALLVGPPGPMAVHTPEVCFSSRAYDSRTEREVVQLSGKDVHTNTFWRLDFKTKNPLADSLRVYYAWSTGDAWQASKSPRIEFGGAPLLYKIQLVARLANWTEDDETDPGRDFLRALEQSGWSLLPA